MWGQVLGDMIDLPGIVHAAAQVAPKGHLVSRTLLHRRQLLQAGLYSALAAGLNQSRSLHASPIAVANPIRACIFLMHYGGPSHLDTWDMKPQAPSEVRGEYRSIATSVPGRFVCEHLPMMSRLVDKVALIRSMHHTMTNHNAAMYEALIGRLPPGGDNELLATDRLNDFPSFGSAIAYLAAAGKLPGPAGKVPITHIALPHVMRNVVDLAGQNAGFLGGRYDPLQLVSDPNQQDFQVRQLTLPSEMSVERLSERRRLLRKFNSSGGGIDGRLESYQQRAFELLRSELISKAFQIETEPQPVRDRYGRHKLGQSLLLARRLVEAGVRFINVNDQEINGQNVNWDSHETIFPRHKELLQPTDQGFSALIEDLDQRGLLDSTLVVAMGEFGRTPKINASAGRDHWPNCFHVVIAGGGVTAGSTYGQSDSIGAYPINDPVTPGDLAATIFWRFGLDHTQAIHDGFGRPFRLSEGAPLAAMFSAS